MTAFLKQRSKTWQASSVCFKPQANARILTPQPQIFIFQTSLIITDRLLSNPKNIVFGARPRVWGSFAAPGGEAIGARGGIQ